MFKNAIVRKPGPSLIKGLTTVDLGKPIYKKALLQHRKYVNLLRSLGLTVTELDADNMHPDSTFVEDVALLTKHCAILTNPGALTRKDEPAAMEPVLQTFFEKIEHIHFPGTLDAGDIMEVGDHYYIGISERTNEKGAQQLIEILNKYGIKGTTINVQGGLHLKSSMSYLENNTLLITSDFSDHPAFKNFHKIEVNPTENYAANSVWVNGKIITPKGFYQTIDQLEDAGLEIIEADVSEFEKIDGGLSCLSLRF